MTDASPAVPWLLAAALVVLGSRGALTRAGTEPLRRKLAIAAGALAVLAALAGVRPMPLPTRGNALHPPTLALAMAIPSGGVTLARPVVSRWEAGGFIGHSAGGLTFPGPDELCRHGLRAPSYCGRRSGLARALQASTLSDAREIGATDLGADCGPEAAPGTEAMLVLDRLDDVPEQAIGEAPVQVVIFGRKVQLRATGEGGGRQIELTPEGGEALRVPVTLAAPAPQEPVQMRMGPAFVRLRVASRVADDGALHVALYDLHVGCS